VLVCHVLVIMRGVRVAVVHVAVLVLVRVGLIVAVF